MEHHTLNTVGDEARFSFIIQSHAGVLAEVGEMWNSNEAPIFFMVIKIHDTVIKMRRARKEMNWETVVEKEEGEAVRTRRTARNETKPR